MKFTILLCLIICCSIRCSCNNIRSIIISKDRSTLDEKNSNYEPIADESIQQLLAYSFPTLSMTNTYDVVNNEKQNTQNNYKVEPIGDVSDLGEGPHWDEKLGELWHVDINNFAVCRLNVDSGTRECRRLRNRGSMVHPYPDSEDFVTTEANLLVRLNWKTGETIVLGEIAPELFGRERFNDGKADAKGRLWVGSLLANTYPGQFVVGGGNLYRFDGNTITKVISGLSVSNGMTWNKENTKMYLNDSRRRRIYVFDFDLEKGTLANQRILVDMVNNTDFSVTDAPDGLTIDQNGDLWSASFNGARIFKVDPNTGRVIDSVSIPCPLVTSVAFGGKNFDEMFVTTATRLGDIPITTAFPTCGRVHRVTAVKKSIQGLRQMFRPNPNDGPYVLLDNKKTSDYRK